MSILKFLDATPKPLTTKPMVEAPISEYSDGGNKVRIYADCVEMGIIICAPYPIQQISHTKLSFALFGQTVRLVLRNGKEPMGVQLSKRDATQCCAEIDALIKKYQHSRGVTADKTFSGTVLGGSGTGFSPAESCIIGLTSSSLQLASNAHSMSLQFSDLTALEFSGPGKVTTTAGVIGGGIGLEGAAIGIGAASLINTLSQKTTTNTIIQLAWQGGEQFVHTAAHTPEECRLLFSSAFTVMNGAKVAPTDDLVSQLEKLSALHIAGHISGAEFSTAKARLLSK